jgi:hypothetical protein
MEEPGGFPFARQPDGPQYLGVSYELVEALPSDPQRPSGRRHVAGVGDGHPGIHCPKRFAIVVANGPAIPHHQG